jgi:hypothetical protein
MNGASNLKKKYLTLLLPIFFFTFVFFNGIYTGTALAADESSEENPIEWAKQLGISATGGVATDPSGDILHLIHTQDFGIQLNKYDKNGQEKWSRKLYQDHRNPLYKHGSVSTNRNGEVFVCYSTSKIQHAVLSKLDAAGTVLWTRNLDPAFGERVFVAAGIKGDVYVAGCNERDNYMDVFLAQYDEMGLQQWTKTISSPGSERPLDIEVDEIGRVYICGTTDGCLDQEGYSGSWCDLFVAKLNGDGDVQWIRQTGHGKYGHRLAITGGIALDNGGNIYFTYGQAGTNWMPALNERWSVVKYDNDGNHIWSTPLNTAVRRGYLPDIAVDSWGNIFTYGVYYTINPTTGKSEVQCYLNKFDSEGNQLLVKELGAKAGNEYVVPHSLAIGEAGSIIMAGATTVSFYGQPHTGTPFMQSNAFLVKFAGDYDTDGDGLLDRWEINGYRTATGFVDLPSMGANPKRKDIFVEIDWLSGHKPDPAAIDEVVRMFALAPITNVDGSTGISLHVDHGSDAIMDFQKEDTWGKLSRANEIPHTDGDDLTLLGDTSFFGSRYLWDEFDSLKKANFRDERSAIFRYCIFGHGPAEEFCIYNDEGEIIGSNSGVARDISSSDFLITLGFWENNGPLEQAGTFMHELGHTLGLKHGGGDDVIGKPNYLSIMNYYYQTAGLIYNGGEGLFDYSRFGHINDLNENHLNEPRGITSSTGEDLSKHGLKWSKSENVILFEHRVNDIDWNSDSRLEPDVAFDVNQDNKLQILTGNFNDWENLSYKGGNVGMGVSNALLPSATDLAPELTSEEDEKLGHPYRVAVKAPDNMAVDRGQGLTCKFTITNAGDQADSYTVKAESTRGWADLSGVPATLDLNSKNSQEITIPVTIPAGAETGQEEYITLTVTSTNNPLMLDRESAVLVVKKKAAGLTRELEKLDLSALNARVSRPVIYGDQIAFAAVPVAGDPYIGIYNLTDQTVTEQIYYMNSLSPSLRSKNPWVDDIDFNGDYVVWHLKDYSVGGNNHLYFADLTQDTVIVTPIGPGNPADMYGTKLAYKDTNGVKTYDLSTKDLVEIPVTKCSGTELIIDADRLFTRYTDPNWEGSYHMYDLVSGTQTELLSSGGTLPRFDVSGNKLVYDALYGPTLDNYGLIVLDVTSNKKREIFFKDYSVDDIRIDDLSGPVMVDNNLATFVCDNNVWLCDLESETIIQVTTDGAYGSENQYFFPKIYKNQIVFGKNGEVYIFTLLPPVTTPVTSLNSVPTEDGKNYDITLETDVPNSLTYYQWDSQSSSGWSQYKGPFNALEGKHRLYYFSQNRAGDSEAVQSTSFTVDTTAPVTVLTTAPTEPDGSCGWFTTPPDVTLTASEPASVYYQWDSDDPACFTKYTDTLIGPKGEHTLYYYSVDQKGNQEEVKSGVLRVQDDADTTPSTTNIVVDPKQPSANGWYIDAPKISLGTGDNATIYYQWDSADNADFKTPVVPEHLLGGATSSNQLTPGWRIYLGEFTPPEGIHTLYYFSIDNSGNRETIKNYTFKTGTEIVTPPDANADLSTVSLGGVQYAPGFNADNLIYTANVSYETSQVAVTPTAASDKAVITVNGSSLNGGSLTVNLNVGLNTIKVLVTAPDGNTTKTYIFNITRASRSNGGESGNSGGSSSPSPALSYEAVVSGTGIPATTLPVNVDTSNKSATTDLGNLAKDIFAGAGTAVLTVPSITGVSSYTLGIPASSLSGTQGEGSLIYTTAAGSIIIPDNILSETPGTEGKKAGITIGQVDNSNLPNELKAAVGDRPVVQLTLTLDGTQTDWNNLDAPVTVSIPYTPTAAELAAPEHIVVWYSDGAGNAVSVPNGRYDPETGAVTFTTTHFSYYAVSYNQVSFEDVANDAWYAKAVSFIAARVITTGTGGGNFSPGAKLTRGQFIVMLMKAYGIAPDLNPKGNFTDAGNTYYTGYLAAAKRLGITAGVGNNMYAPGNQITRQEMFTLLYNALKVIGQLPQGNSGKTLPDFSDASKIASWAKEAMSNFVRTGTVSGSGGKLNPTGTTTRAEMAQVLYNLLGK